MKEDLRTLQAALGSRYRLSHEIGHGGMARVYLAEDSEGGRAVALKVLRRELTAILGTTRFQREIEILTRLRHPNIVPVLDSGDAGTRVYYVMPYIAGDSLRTLLERQVALPVTQAISLCQDIGAAIDYAHACGVLHRDVKPENVLLDERGAVVCDFGVARAIEVAGSESFSSSGLVIGTPAYMSPEQAAGGPLDRSTDIYALGCLMYEMLTGEPPFAGATAQAVLARKLVERPRSLRVVRPDVPLHLEEVVMGALEFVPTKRPASAGLLGRALHDVDG